jgi:hypothetical protein
MPILRSLRNTPPSRFRRIGWLLCVCLASMTAQAKGPEKMKVLSLEELGQQAVGGRPQTPGNTVATVHFVGEHHLLVTFPVRRLMKRLPDTQPGDDDRMIDAVLVDIPSGKVAARTTWRVHDAGQYLWDLGNGRFMLRIRSHLVTVEPLVNLSKTDPFEEHKLLTFDDRIVGLIVSAESDLLTVETNSRPREDVTKVAIKTSDTDVTISFFRLLHTPEAVIATHAGAVRSSIPLALPLTADGYLDISEESKTRWLFDYLPHEGKKLELSPYETSCFPRAVFVSRSEFIAFGCRGSVDKVEIGGFNMKAEEMWEQVFSESFFFPTFSFAPSSDRFALGRALSNLPSSMLVAEEEPSGSFLTAQDIQVYQASTGRPVFHTTVTPVQRSGQNFSLSADGMQIAVIRDAAIEIYQLPAPSGRDKQEAKANREFALERSTGPIRLPTRTKVAAVVAEAAASPAPSAPAAPEAAPTTPATPAKPQVIENPVNVGDVPSEEGRKRPTLYNPGESAPK